MKNPLLGDWVYDSDGDSPLQAAFHAAFAAAGEVRRQAERQLDIDQRDSPQVLALRQAADQLEAAAEHLRERLPLRFEPEKAAPHA